MNEYVSKVTPKGRVTIPDELRSQMGLESGGKIAFVVDDDGNVTLRRLTFSTIESIAGAAGKLDKPMTFKEMRRIAYEDRFREKYGRHS